jgi:UDP-N-acetylglucosamine diphosphorylase/glucosamine-1-phosphate N-acetyltransferase
MNVVVFEDAAVERLGPNVAARPAASLSVAGWPLAEALASFGRLRHALRPHLSRYVDRLAGTRVPHWGGGWGLGPEHTRPALPPPVSRYGGTLLLVNARLVPARRQIAMLRNLIEAGRRGVVRADDAVAAAVLHVHGDGDGGDDLLVSRLLAGQPADAVFEDGQLPALELGARLLAWPHDLISAHEQELNDTLAALIDTGRFREERPGLFVEKSATVADHVAVREGPVVIEAGATISPFVCLDGPIRIGPRVRIHPHAWLRPGTVIGHDGRVGGEVESSVLEPFANKPHEGFLGHSHLGSWVNIGAGTVTGNLKVSYGTIRLPLTDGTRWDTGRQFLGAQIGDFVRTATLTSIPCGATIGVAATVAGAVPATTPSFHCMLASGDVGSATSPEQAATVLGRMMARRGLVIHEADRELLVDLASLH